MTVADVIRMLLEMDQQFISGRPSALGRAAEIVQTLARHAEPSLRNPALMGDWESIDLSPVRSWRTSKELWQPTMGLAEENDKLRSDIDGWKLIDELRERKPQTIVHRNGGRWDLFDSNGDARKFVDEARAAGEKVEPWNVSTWNWHLNIEVTT
jgi:hypothetical protein